MVDQKQALLTLYESDKEEHDASKGGTPSLFSGILVEHIAIVNLLKVAFDSLWQQAVPLETYVEQNITLTVHWLVFLLKLLIFIIFCCFAYELFISKPEFAAVMNGFLPKTGIERLCERKIW